jgi:para-nitrobenzyl esterase
VQPLDFLAARCDGAGVMTFSPVVDGDVRPAPPWAAFAAGAARDVELLIGHGRDEYSLLAAELPDIDDADVDVLIDRLTPTPGASRYRTAFPDLAGNELRETALSDWLFRMPALHLAEAAVAGGARVWFYELRWGFGPRGASHGLDTLLVFGTTDVYGEVTAAGPAALAEARQLSPTMRADHLAFANTGDPGWPRFQRPDRLTRVYDPEPGLIRYPEERSRTIWRDRRFGVLELTAQSRSTPARSTPARSTPARSTPASSTPASSTPGSE